MAFCAREETVGRHSVASVHTQLHIVCTDAYAHNVAHAAALTPHVSAQDVQLRLALPMAESGRRGCKCTKRQVQALPPVYHPLLEELGR